MASAVAEQVELAAEHRPAISYWNEASLPGVVYLVTVLRTTWTYDNKLLAEVQASLLPGEIPPVRGCDIAAEWRLAVHPADSRASHCRPSGRRHAKPSARGAGNE